jgi:hypothetical protein
MHPVDERAIDGGGGEAAADERAGRSVAGAGPEVASGLAAIGAGFVVAHCRLVALCWVRSGRGRGGKKMIRTCGVCGVVVAWIC